VLGLYALAKRMDDMSFIFFKANDMLSSYLVFGHQRGGWKIQPGV